MLLALPITTNGFLYYQSQEGFRKDLTLINIDLLQDETSYKKHKLYPNVQFPGNKFTEKKNLPKEFDINGKYYTMHSYAHDLKESD